MIMLLYYESKKRNMQIRQNISNSNRQTFEKNIGRLGFLDSRGRMTLKYTLSSCGIPWSPVAFPFNLMTATFAAIWMALGFDGLAWGLMFL